MFPSRGLETRGKRSQSICPALFIFAGMLVCWAPLASHASDPPLTSLHGMTSTAYDVDPEFLSSDSAGTVSEVWAKGDFIRYEFSFAGGKLVSVQRGDLLYSFSPDDAFGSRLRLAGGLGTSGLINQISKVQANGHVVRTDVDGGELYDTYLYNDAATGEEVRATLSRDTCLPLVWIGLLPNGNVTVIDYWDMEANPELPDDLFDIPAGVDFSATLVCEFAAQQQGQQANEIRQICIAATGGKAEAQYQLGYLYYRIAKGPQDLKRASWWYRQAANQGHAHSQYNMGVMYRDGLGVTQDVIKAFAWLATARLQGADVSEGVLKAVLDNMSAQQKLMAEELAIRYREEYTRN